MTKITLGNYITNIQQCFLMTFLQSASGKHDNDMKGIKFGMFHYTHFPLIWKPYEFSYGSLMTINLHIKPACNCSSKCNLQREIGKKARSRNLNDWITFQTVSE